MHPSANVNHPSARDFSSITRKLHFNHYISQSKPVSSFLYMLQIALGGKSKFWLLLAAVPAPAWLSRSFNVLIVYKRMLTTFRECH